MWRRIVNIKWLYTLLRKYLFCHIKFVDWKRKHINADYYFTVCIVGVTPHIREDVYNISIGNNRNLLNTVIKTLFVDSSEKELHENLDTFWSEYNYLNNKNDTFDSKKFIWSSKDIFMVIVVCGIINTLYHAPKYLVFELAG